MKDQETVFSLEIRTPRGKFELDASSTSLVSELRGRIAELMKVPDPTYITIICGGKTAPTEASLNLSDFLTSPPIPLGHPDPMGLKKFVVYAICIPQIPMEIPPPKDPEDAKAREAVLDLMPSHIREELEAGGSRFIDLVSSWQRRMRTQPEATERQLRSPETQNLLKCMRTPPKPPKSGPSTASTLPVGCIDTDTIIGTPQNTRILEEVLSQHRQQLNNCNQQLGIHQDIRFYREMMQQSLRLPQPPQQPKIQPKQTQQQQPEIRGGPMPKPDRTQDAAKSGSVASKPPSSAAAEAFERARHDLQLLRREAPELLSELMRDIVVDEPSASSRTPEQQQRQQQQEQRQITSLSEQLESTDNPLAQLAQLSGLMEQFTQALGSSGSPDHVQLLPQLHEMGFKDDGASLLALQATNGDLNAAVNILSQQED